MRGSRGTRREQPGGARRLRTVALLFSVFAGIALLGCGDDETATVAPTTASGTGGAGGGGGAGGAGGEAPELVNGCDYALAEAPGNTFTITTTGLAYTPRCSRTHKGATVTVESNFDNFPLRGGTVAGGELIPDPSSPIPSTDTGDTVTFTMPATGIYGFYCEVYGLAGMNGTIFVE